jgi:hypothetical protein
VTRGEFPPYQKATPMALLAQAMGGYSMIQLGAIILVIAGVCAVVMVVLRQLGVTIPPFIVTILWIVLAVMIGILALYFLGSMISRLG